MPCSTFKNELTVGSIKLLVEEWFASVPEFIALPPSYKPVISANTATVEPTSAGATTVEVADVTGIDVGDIMIIGAGDGSDTAESAVVAAVSTLPAGDGDSAGRARRAAGVVTLKEALEHSHPAGITLLFVENPVPEAAAAAAAAGAEELETAAQATDAPEAAETEVTKNSGHMNKLALAAIPFFLVAFYCYVGAVFGK